MKILFVSTVSNTINAFLIPHIKMLIDNGHQIDVAFRTVNEVKSDVFAMGCKVFNLPFERSPLKFGNYLAYRRLKKIILDGGYDLIHTHTPIASACVRLACRKNKKTKVIYTAHGFHFYKGAPIKNWLLYYPIELYLARYTDTIITINSEDFERASSFKSAKVAYMPGVGIDTSKFYKVDIDKLEIRKQLGIQSNAKVILSIGELNKNKNHEVVIRALAQINDTNITYVICGEGSLDNYLRKLVSKLRLNDRVKLLGYRSDIVEICKSSDLFVLPSMREGLPVSLMEAMACGLPVICSDIRGNRDLVTNKKGGYLVKANDIDMYAKLIQEIFSNHDIMRQMGQYNYEIVKKNDISNIKMQLSEIYNTFI